jgi:type IV pilus assembly protein PilB
LVGETRSATTAETVINAALTGHLVFTTLHTNGAIESITRLLSMGVKPFLLAPSVHLVCAQRLVRQLCPHCSTRQEADFAAREEIMQTTERLSRLTGVSVPERDGTVPVPT